MRVCLAADLRALGHDVDTVQDGGLVGYMDTDVWRAAQVEERFFITQDLDFSDIRLFGPGSHADGLLVRLSQPGQDALHRRVREIFSTQQVEEWTRCMVITSDHKIRVRRVRGNTSHPAGS